MAGDVESLIERVLASRRDLTAHEREELRVVLRVRCNTADERPRGCSAGPGIECTSLGAESRGQRLLHLRWHWCRARRAGLRLEPTSDAELRGDPKPYSATERGQRQAAQGRPDYGGMADR
jgi:hypothetical protein